MRPPLRDLAAAVVAAAATSLLYAAAYPPYRYAILAWIALVPFLLAVRRSSALASTVAAIAFPLIACALTIAWMPRAAATYYGQPFVVGILTFLAIALVMVAPYVIGFALLYRYLSRRPSVVTPLAAGALWVLAEYARSHALTGNPFVLLGYSHAGDPLLRQIADLSGVYGVSFVLAAANAALAELYLALRREAAWRQALGGALAVAVLMSLSYGYGAWRVAAEPAGNTPPTKVLLVQGNLDLGSQWRDDLYGQNLDVYLRMTVGGMRQHAPALVVWPENAMTFFLAREPLYRLSIAQVISTGGVQLVAGGPHFIADGERYLNSAFLVAADGEILARYDKEKLLPFAEYFPLGQFDLLRRSFGRVREFTIGQPSPPLPTVAGHAGILICNEAMFPEIAARRVAAGADVLINLANDSWIGDAQYAELALDMSVFRAVEQRRYVIRSSTSGPSAIIDDRGGVRERSATSSQAIVSGEVERRAQTSIYAMVGDLFVVICALSIIAALWRARAGAKGRMGCESS
jgi:apolipoprotein N-acyltransferase